MQKPRTIAAITTSRADFTHLYWPLKAIDAHPRLELKLIETGAHLSPEFGRTGDEIRQAGLVVDASIECLLSSDTDVGMAKTIGVAVCSLADLLGAMRPDVLLLIADRFEMLAPAAVALALRIPVAHIEGGEVSEGAIDDAVRNALTKIAHIHFTPHDDATRRVLAMGEERWRVHETGAPSLDHLRRSELLDDRVLAARLGIRIRRPLCVVAMHPVTLAADPVADAGALFAALSGLNAQIAVCFPNADVGSRALLGIAERFCAATPDAHLYVNLGAIAFFSLLRTANLLVGNSSSGIMESASWALPTVNVGDRQRGRLRAANVVDAPGEPGAIRAAIARALTPDFRDALGDLRNPYGNGHAGERIADALAALPDRDRLLSKRAAELYDAPFGPAFRHQDPQDR